MIVIVHLYKCVADKYDTFRRKVLKMIFSAFKGPACTQPLECLRWLENHRLEVLNLETDYTKITTKASNLLKEMHNNRSKFL